jgi:hypothetical protein
MVWALGTTTDINNLFSERLKGKISRIPITEVNIYKDTAIYSLVLSAITKSLSQKHGLHCDNRNLIWEDQSEMKEIINGLIYFTHKAIRLSITSDGRKHYLSLTPDFYVTNEIGDNKIEKEIRQQVGLSYFQKIWNKPYNEYIDKWRKIFFTTDNAIVEVEYPLNSGSGFYFKIRKSPGFAGIYNELLNGVVVSNQFPKQLIIYDGIKYLEPELIFSPRHAGMTVVPRDFHPMRGVSSNRPYDYKLAGTTSNEMISLGVVCPKTDSGKFSSFLKNQLSKVDSNGRNGDYLIPFPGFYEAFSTSLNIPDPGNDQWSFCPEPSQTRTLKDGATDLRNHITRCIDQLTTDAAKKVIIIYIPGRWLDFTSYDLENEHYDLHDFIKAYCAERAIPTQFIQEDTISNPLQCQINWWLSLSYYVKSMRTPWVLDSLDKDTAFAGIGYSVTSQEGVTDIVLGCSHIYNSKGQGLKYRLSKMQDKLFWDRQKRPHLSYKDAYKLGVSTIDLFYNTMNEFPQRVVVHKRTYFTPDELNGLKDSLLSGGVVNLDLIEINFEDDIRFVASKLNYDGMPQIDSFSVQRGTCLLLNSYEALLWTHGVVPSVKNPNFKFYLGGRYIPGPLRIKKHYGQSNIGLIATEILGLTKVNWNSFDLYSQLPATVNSSNEIARIGRLLSRKEGITYDYRYFI